VSERAWLEQVASLVSLTRLQDAVEMSQLFLQSRWNTAEAAAQLKQEGCHGSPRHSYGFR